MKSQNGKSTPHARHELLVGVDVGGTKVAVLVVDADLRTLSRTTQPTALDSPEATLQGIASAVEEGVRRAGADMSNVAAVGLGIPGRVEPATGTVRHAVNLGWDEMPVGARLSQLLGVPCLLENDVRAAAMGVQQHLGDAAGPNMAYVGVGTGIAAGLILGGKVYRGAHGMAGEIGHMIVEPGGMKCPCGARGCLETLAAGPAVARMGKESAASHADTLLRQYTPVTSEAVYRAARAGDAAALDITQKVAHYLALALQQLIVAYDLDSIVLGGGVSREGETFLRPLLDELARLREGSALTGEMLQPDRITLLPPDFDAGTWGAVILAGKQQGVAVGN
jgi:glucokinase